jgi:hypothetical protein
MRPLTSAILQSPKKKWEKRRIIIFVQLMGFLIFQQQVDTGIGDEEEEEEQPLNHSQQPDKAAYHHRRLVVIRRTHPRGPNSLFRMWGAFVMSIHPCEP